MESCNSTMVSARALLVVLVLVMAAPAGHAADAEQVTVHGAAQAVLSAAWEGDSPIFAAETVGRWARPPVVPRKLGQSPCERLRTGVPAASGSGWRFSCKTLRCRRLLASDVVETTFRHGMNRQERPSGERFPVRSGPAKSPLRPFPAGRGGPRPSRMPGHTGRSIRVRGG